MLKGKNCKSIILKLHYILVSYMDFSTFSRNILTLTY